MLLDAQGEVLGGWSAIGKLTSGWPVIWPWRLYTRLIALRGTDLYALRIRPAHPGLRGGARSGLLEFADMFVTFGDARLHPKRAIKLFRLLPELACKFQIAMCFV